MSSEQISRQTSETLAAAIEGLYRTFAVYEFPRHTDYCPCCHTQANEDGLRAKPLRELNVADLLKYGFDALLTWGDAAFFKHMMPRVFELMTIPRGLAFEISPEILLSKLRRAEWLTWPTHEQQAVRFFLHSLWHTKLGEPVYDSFNEETETWLCAIAQAEDVLAAYLEQWAADSRVSAAEALSAFILRTAITRNDKSGRDPFWDGRDVPYEELRLWVRSEEAKSLLYRAIASASEDAGEEFVAALSMLEA